MQPVHQRGLLAITWPIFVEQAARILPGAVNALMLSHLGDQVVAGVTVANQLVGFCVILFSFIGIGCSVVITHSLGARDHAGAQRLAAAAIGVNLWAGLIVSLAMSLGAGLILRVLDLPAGVGPVATPYLALIGGTLFLEAANIAMGAILRAHGHTRDAMWVTASANVASIGLNIVLIYGLFGLPELGVMGAALSNVLCRIGASLVLLRMVRWRTDWSVKLRYLWQLERHMVGRILHIGGPAAGENLSWWLSFMTVTYFVGQMGETSLATFSYVRQISFILIILPISIGLGTEIMVGHMIGAGEDNHAYKRLLHSLKLSFATALATSAVVALLAPQLLGMFTNTPAVIAGGALLVRLSLLLEPGRTFNLVVINALRATGDARFPVLMGMCSMWGIMVPFSWLFGIHFGWGLPGVWAAVIMDEWVRGIAMYIRWRSRAWERHAHASRSRVAAQA